MSAVNKNLSTLRPIVYARVLSNSGRPEPGRIVALSKELHFRKIHREETRITELVNHQRIRNVGDVPASLQSVLPSTPLLTHVGTHRCSPIYHQFSVSKLTHCAFAHNRNRLDARACQQPPTWIVNFYTRVVSPSSYARSD